MVFLIPSSRAELFWHGVTSAFHFLSTNMSKVGVQKRPPLPSKESSLFKELLTLYETKQLKKGLKTADQILKKVPDHGGKTLVFFH